MDQTKRGKNIRVPAAALPELESLREKMSRVTSLGGVAVQQPRVKLGDGMVIGWALAMCNFLMNERFSVVDRYDFADKFFDQLEPHLADFADRTPDEIKAHIRMLAAASAELGGYNTADTLRAAKHEGSVS